MFCFKFKNLAKIELHMHIWLLIRSVLSFKLFAPSPYDFRVDPEERVYEGYFGFLKKHFYVPDSNHFGELSMMSLNAHIDRDTLEKKQQESLMGLIDLHHPSIFSIQGLSQGEFDSLKPVIDHHYETACKDALFSEVWTNKIEVLPILYDRYAIVKIRDYVFQPKEYEKQAYGCLGVFYSKLTEQIFSVVNVDLPSTDENLVNAEFYNILEHLESSDVKDYPIFVTGTINKLSDKLKKLMDTNFINLNAIDKNNIGLNKTTFHRHGHVNDNIQRDFILLKDTAKKFKLNYSRTLSRYPKDNFEHFANFSIVSRTPVDKTENK